VFSIPVPEFNFNKYLPVVILAMTGLLLGAYAGGGGDGVVYDRLRWDCGYAGGQRQCEVAFVLANQTPKQQVRKVNIRAVRKPADSSPAEAQVCGQMHFSILLEPLEILEIREKIWVSAKPDKITVSVVE
jgi:hypothetical protein